MVPPYRRPELVARPVVPRIEMAIGGVGSGAPFDGQYTCTKTTLVYTAPSFGGQSTWTRAS